MKFLRVVFVCLIVVLVAATNIHSPVYAEASKTPPLHSEEATPLEVIGDAGKTIHHVDAKIESDGSVSIVAEGSYVSGGPALAYDFVVDAGNKTIQFTEIKPDQLAMPAIAPATQANVIGVGQARVRVVGKDPVLMVVNETTNYLYWHRFDDGTVKAISYNDLCYAANPTPIGTHWFTTNCPVSLPWNNGPAQVVNNANGEYINWDFWLDTSSTSMTHFSQIVGLHNGTFNYSWSWNAWGEASDLLHATLYLN